MKVYIHKTKPVSHKLGSLREAQYSDESQDKLYSYYKPHELRNGILISDVDHTQYTVYETNEYKKASKQIYLSVNESDRLYLPRGDYYIKREHRVNKESLISEIEKILKTRKDRVNHEIELLKKTEELYENVKNSNDHDEINRLAGAISHHWFKA